MLGLIVQLILSWILIRAFERKGLSVLGFMPTSDRLLHFFVFFTITGIICASGFFLKMHFGNQAWIVNPNLSGDLIWKGSYWTTISVLFEELIFRGVLLYILIRRIGSTKAIIISAIAFGIYHWFSFGVIGNIIQMIFVFFITGAMGLVLAYGYAQTRSLYVPIAIHLGWNITQIFIFSQGQIGDGIFIPAQPAPFRTDSYFVYFAVTFVPVIAALVINFLLLRTVKAQTLEP